MGPNVLLLFFSLKFSSDFILAHNEIDVNVVFNGEVFRKRIANKKADLLSELDSIILEQNQPYKSILKTPEYWNIYYKNKLVTPSSDSVLNSLHNNDFVYLYYTQKGIDELYLGMDLINKIVSLIKKLSSKSSSNGSNSIDKVELIKLVESIVTSDYFKLLIQTILLNGKGFDWNLVAKLLTSSSFSNSLSTITSHIANNIANSTPQAPSRDPKRPDKVFGIPTSVFGSSKASPPSRPVKKRPRSDKPSKKPEPSKFKKSKLLDLISSFANPLFTQS